MTGGRTGQSDVTVSDFGGPIQWSALRYVCVRGQQWAAGAALSACHADDRVIDWPSGRLLFMELVDLSAQRTSWRLGRLGTLHVRAYCTGW